MNSLHMTFTALQHQKNNDFVLTISSFSQNETSVITIRPYFTGKFTKHIRLQIREVRTYSAERACSIAETA